MGKSKKKNKKVIKSKDFQGVNNFLDELKLYFNGENHSIDLDDLPNIEDLYKVDLSVKRKEGQFQIKFKAKELDSELVAQQKKRSLEKDEGKIKYKELKKRMKRDFKAIKTALLEKTLPDPEITKSFLSDSNLMTSYPGYGDEYYDAFQQACHEFSEAFEANHLERMGLAFLKLDKLRQDCHDRYL